jgi:hypothetical protein
MEPREAVCFLCSSRKGPLQIADAVSPYSGQNLVDVVGCVLLDSPRTRPDFLAKTNARLISNQLCEPCCRLVLQVDRLDVLLEKAKGTMRDKFCIGNTGASTDLGNEGIVVVLADEAVVAVDLDDVEEFESMADVVSDSDEVSFTSDFVPTSKCL